MANPQAPSFDQLLQESRRKKKAEQLAQEIFGKKNRSQTPQGPRGKPAPGASLASRVGVAKRPASLPRVSSAPAPRNARPPPQVSRPAHNGPHRARSTHYELRPQQQPHPPSEFVPNVKSNESNGYANYEAPGAATNGSANISFRGAAATQHVVIAQNFAPGTTAADIESVMVDVGGAVTECKLLEEEPTVIAEMTFVDKSGAEAVINTFDGKKADGRTLNVFLKAGGGAKMPFVVDVEPTVDEPMEMDENAQAREAEDRRREERRGPGPAERAPPRAAPPRDDYPTGPRGHDRGYQNDYYNRGPRRAEPAYQDGRYGFGGGGGGRHHGGGGGYRHDGRLGGYGGRGGQTYRPL